jgi:serine/threonine-protein kinase RsbW
MGLDSRQLGLTLHNGCVTKLHTSMNEPGRLLRMSMRSVFDMLDFVQIVSDRMSQMAGLDEDAIHWVGVAIRESVINAIKHGNRLDETKQVVVEFAFVPVEVPQALVVTILDQGEGFEPEEVADPLAPENMLKSSGRGIFFMRSFMDDVQLKKRPEGGMEVRLVKQLPKPPAFAAAAATPQA